MAKRGLISSGAGGSGVNSYIDLENRPDDVIDTTIVPATTTGGEFTPNNDNTNKASVSISADGTIITTTRTNNAWGGSGTFSTESIDGDGYISFKLTRIGKRFMFGLSRASDAGSTTYSTIDFAIYITSSSIQIYENSSNKGGFTSSFVNGGTYKVKRTGNTITYLVNDVVFYTSATTTTVPLHMDTAFYNTASRMDEVTMLNTPVTPVPRTATYKIDYNNVNLINKPVIHVNVLVSDTNFATIALALADDAVKTAHAGDFVEITGDIYHVIKTNPTVADDLLKGGGVEDFNELANRPLQAPASEITAGTGTSYRLFNVDNIKTLGAWAGIVGKPNQITNAEIAGSNINDIRLFSPNDVKAIVLTNAISSRASRLINPDNYASIAGALADEEVGNAIAGDWVKVNDVFYSIITTSPTVEADFLLIGNVTQLQLESKTVSWAQVTDKSSIFEITNVPLTPAVFSANINQWATGASAEKTYQNKTSGDYSAGNMRGAPTSVLGSDQSAWRQGWLINDVSAWIELTYDTPVYITSVQIRQVYNIGSIHKVRVWNNGEFTTVWGRHIDNGTDIQGGTVTGEVTGKKSDVLITLTNMLEYPVDKIRIDIGSTSATWDGVDSVQLTGKTLVSAEQPARTDTKISYNNLEDKPTIPTLPAQVSSAEKTAKTGTALRSFSPKDIADMDTGGGGGTGNFYDLSDIPSILRVVPESVTFSGRIVQWATGATASSQFSTGEYSASRAIGSPNTGLAVGANGADNPNAWAENSVDRNKVNNITLTYSNAVYIVVIIVRETLNSGTISKVEVEKDGAFVTVYTRSFATGAQVGGLITGEASGKVTDTTITLNTQLDYKSNKVRISTGDTRNVFNEIDAVRLTGSLGKTVTPRRVDISYSDLEDKPTSPPEITDAQVTSGTGTDEVLPTPAKLKVMIETHSNGITPSFETISSNLMAWDVVARTYTDDPSDASKKVLASVGISDSSDATKVVVITYTWNSNGTIQNEVLSFSNRVFPATVKKTKTYSYTDGRISRIVYT